MGFTLIGRLLTPSALLAFVLMASLFATEVSHSSAASCAKVYANAKSTKKLSPGQQVIRHFDQMNASQAAELRAERAAWNNYQFSDPRQHDPSKEWSYLVHSLDLTGTSAIGESKWIDIVAHPKRITDLATLSTSVIANRKSTTYLGFSWGGGVILKAPASTLMAAKPGYEAGDLRSGRVAAASREGNFQLAAQESATKYQEYGLPSPNEVLSRTSPQFHNEVLLATKDQNGQAVEIIGYYVLIMKGQRSSKLVLTQDEFQSVQNAAMKNNLPLIYIEVPLPRNG